MQQDSANIITDTNRLLECTNKTLFVIWNDQDKANRDGFHGRDMDEIEISF